MASFLMSVGGGFVKMAGMAGRRLRFATPRPRFARCEPLARSLPI